MISKISWIWNAKSGMLGERGFISFEFSEKLIVQLNGYIYIGEEKSVDDR